MEIIKFEKIDSTNAYLKKEQSNLTDFTVATALEQSEGRGRENRRWISNNGENLLFSILLKDKTLISKFNHISLAVASAIGKVLENYGLNDVSIKWPNDVYVQGKKICGVLLEGNIDEYLVIGVGINVNQEVFPIDLRHPATSIYLEISKKQSLDNLLDDVLKEISGVLGQINHLNFIYQRFINEHNYLLNKAVKVNNLQGIVLGLDEENKLIVKVNDKCVSISSGEVSIL